MLRASDSETEILLGNKQLLGIFFVVVLLLAVAFYGGFMVGRNGSGHKVTAVTTAQDETGSAPQSAGGGGETHVVAAGQSATSDQSSTAGSDGSGSQELQPPTRSRQTDQPLGSPKHKAAVKNDTAEAEPAGATASEGFAPQVGQQFLQVAAVSREEAVAVADVLHKKGFRAHAVPKPGNPKIYRVIIGPIRDPGELSSTREALTRTGFREVILQRY